MSILATLITSDLPYVSLTLDDRSSMLHLAASKYLIPLFWIALFDEHCLVFKPWEDKVFAEEEQSGEYPILQSPRDDALYRFQNFRTHCSEYYRKDAMDCFQSFLAEHTRKWIAIETWEFSGPGDTGDMLREAIQAAVMDPRESDVWRLWESRFSTEWKKPSHEMDRTKLSIPELCGGRWEMDVPWEKLPDAEIPLD